jgi:hypothetical protein
MHDLLTAFLPDDEAGARFHRAALEALHRGDPRKAHLLLERAAVRYRRGVIVEPLARARVHQLIARARLGTEDSEALGLEIARCLCRLSRIESLDPPFSLIDARVLLAGLLAAGSGAEAPEERRAA